MNKLRFDELPLSRAMMKAVSDMGFEEASPIQSETIPLLLEGLDITGQAQTGTGKTAAFAIPVIERLDPAAGNPQAIVLCPTRELVIQVTGEFQRLMKYMDPSQAVSVYGGQEIERQLRALRKRPAVIIGTPGRTMDHIRRGSIMMDSVRMVVLDEADEMLDMGFRDDIEIILKDTPADRQTILFSATMSREILALARSYQKDPVRIDVTAQKLNAPRIEQSYYEIPEKSKVEALARIIDYYDLGLSLVFCNTKSQVEGLVENLKARGLFADGLHGDMNQRQRERVMSGFRKGSIEVLVATDVAGRGIDVSGVSAVFNYDLPRDDEDYIHRIGRTGRAGNSGRAFTFVSGRQLFSLRRIEKTNGVTIVRRAVPTIEDLDETRLQEFRSRIKSVIGQGRLARYENMVESLMSDEYTSMDIAAALIKIAMDSKNEGYDDTQRFDVENHPKRKKIPDYAAKKKMIEKEKKRFSGKGFQHKPGGKGGAVLKKKKK